MGWEGQDGKEVARLGGRLEETHGAQLQPLRHCPKSLDSHQPRALLARNAMQQVICYLAARSSVRVRPGPLLPVPFTASMILRAHTARLELGFGHNHVKWICRVREPEI